MNENDISRVIVTSAVEVHRVLGGPGLLESAYEEALCCELSGKGILVARQVQVPIHYKRQILATPLRIDVLANEKVIIEIKATTQYNPIFEAQALTYLRLTGLKLALVINFGERVVKSGIHRVVNNL